MKKVAHYLQEHLLGEVMTDTDVRKYFSTDTSIFQITPSVIVYPRNEQDIRKVARFTWQLAERGRPVPVTARGAGTDQGGGALGSGIMLVFPAHMNKIIEMDGKSGLVTVEPGLNYGKMQQTLHTHNRFLPPFPSSIEFCTIGGAVANNAAGEKSFKYGATRNFVKGLRVILANGEAIETRRLSKREMNKKLGQSNFEGEIYRQLDALIEENKDMIAQMQPKVSKNSAGYPLNLVKEKNSFDLTPLFVGSQGTLGVITEVVLSTEPYNPQSILVAAMFDDLQLASQVLPEIRNLPEKPSTIEFVDESLLQFVYEHNPNNLKGIVDKPFPKLVMLIEFDNSSDRVQKRMAKKVAKILSKYQIDYKVETDPDAKEELWKIRHSAATVTSYSQTRLKSVPIVEDGVVPADKFSEYMVGAKALFEKYGFQSAMWGHAGDANVHMQPLLDLSQVGDRQRAFKLIDDYYKLVINLGGSTSGEHGDGRLRGPYLKELYGDKVYEMFRGVKKIFDPYGTMNPGVKIDATIENAKSIVRDDYSLEHLYDHMPRT